MQNKWYGDKRDLVKWRTLIHLAGEDPAVRILQVLMIRPDCERDSRLAERGPHGVRSCGISESAFDHFRRVQNITCLDKRIAIYDKPFPEKDQGRCQEERDRYFRAVCEWIGRFRGKRRVVLVDPDTGIKQKRRTWKHIEDRELKELYQQLGRGDTLVLYQHGQLFRKGWLRATLAQFAKAVKVGTNRVRVFQCCELARDVALFAVTRS